MTLIIREIHIEVYCPAMGRGNLSFGRLMKESGSDLWFFSGGKGPL